MNRSVINLVVLACIAALLAGVPVMQDRFAAAVVAQHPEVPSCEIVDAVLADVATRGFNSVVVDFEPSLLVGSTHKVGMDYFKLSGLQARAPLQAHAFEPSNCGHSNLQAIHPVTREIQFHLEDIDRSEWGKPEFDSVRKLEFGRMIWEAPGETVLLELSEEGIFMSCWDVPPTVYRARLQNGEWRLQPFPKASIWMN